MDGSTSVPIFPSAAVSHFWGALTPVPHALTQYVTLKLRKRGEDMKCKLAARSSGVDVFGEGRGLNTALRVYQERSGMFQSAFVADSKSCSDPAEDPVARQFLRQSPGK
jgi:hypothetical protein